MRSNTGHLSAHGQSFFSSWRKAPFGAHACIYVARLAIAHIAVMGRSLMRGGACPFSSDVVSSKYTYSGLSYLQFKKYIHMN